MPRTLSMHAYSDARELLDEALVLVSQTLEYGILQQWEAGTLPRTRDRSSGAFVSEGETLAILGGAVPSAEGLERLAALESALAAGWERMETRLEASRAAGAPLPFDVLRRAFALSATEQRALWMLAGVELSPRLRQLMRYLCNDAARQQPDVGLLEETVYAGAEAREVAIHELAADGRLLANHLVEPVGGDRGAAPHMLQPLRLASRVIELLHGVLRLDPALALLASLERAPASSSELLVPAELRARVDALVAAAARAGEPGPAVMVVGREGSGRRTLLAGAARAAGLAVIRVRTAALPADPGPALLALVREARLFGALLVLESVEHLAGAPGGGGDGQREARVDALLSRAAVPLAGTSAPRDDRPMALARGVIRIDVPFPGEADRERLWRRVLDGVAVAAEVDPARLAARYTLTGGVLARAFTAARALAGARGAAVTEDDIHVGLRGTLDEKLARLGQLVGTTQTWDDVVLPEDTVESLRELVARVQHRRRVFDDWGFAGKLSKGLGLSALFAGPPGTGKTMVAALVARELNLDLYQIDVSRMVSKYIGETEKNLAEVFDAAESGHSILLFDEADSLFAARGEVKSSTDRYANLETNYLLQRMERFGGITILTTNLASSLDPAFLRRIAFKIDFPMPEEEDRERLWRAMFPRAAAVSQDVDLRDLARRYVMSGGHVRNAVLRAAFLAAADDGPICLRHLKKAADIEYGAIGKVVRRSA